jgi:hypothetical protein
MRGRLLVAEGGRKDTLRVVDASLAPPLSIGQVELTVVTVPGKVMLAAQSEYFRGLWWGAGDRAGGECMRGRSGWCCGTSTRLRCRRVGRGGRGHEAAMVQGEMGSKRRRGRCWSERCSRQQTCDAYGGDRVLCSQWPGHSGWNYLQVCSYVLRHLCFWNMSNKFLLGKGL